MTSTKIELKEDTKNYNKITTVLIRTLYMKESVVHRTVNPRITESH